MGSLRDYHTFLDNKRQLSQSHGFEPLWMPDFLFDFQRDLTEWAIRKGRAAIFADCGLGKTPMQLVWAENVVRKTTKPVLILTPLSVGYQTVREGQKFEIECARSGDGVLPNGAKIVVTNYERLHYFTPDDFAGCVCDESSILKNFKGAIKSQVTEFMKKIPYRLLCTATAAPNDYVELGTSSESLGELGFMDMLQRFFKSTDGSYAQGGSKRTRYQGFASKYRFRGHAEKDFWRWVCSWARAIRKPSDMGYEDGNFILPELIAKEHVVTAAKSKDGHLFDVPAVTLQEQREERRRSLQERCELAASLAQNNGTPCICWVYLNDESKTLTDLIDGAHEVTGCDSDDKKEETFRAFQDGKIKTLVTKPTIAGYGLNWQHCSRQTFFPSHSYEQWYQAVRRSWRFGQQNPVHVHMIASEGERGVLSNLRRKDEAASEMFAELARMIDNELHIERSEYGKTKERIPAWL